MLTSQNVTAPGRAKVVLQLTLKSKGKEEKGRSRSVSPSKRKDSSFSRFFSGILGKKQKSNNTMETEASLTTDSAAIKGDISPAEPEPKALTRQVSRSDMSVATAPAILDSSPSVGTMTPPLPATPAAEAKAPVSILKKAESKTLKKVDSFSSQKSRDSTSKYSVSAAPMPSPSHNPRPAASSGSQGPPPAWLNSMDSEVNYWVFQMGMSREEAMQLVAYNRSLPHHPVHAPGPAYYSPPPYANPPRRGP
eukprot:gene41226-50313_t